MITETHFLRLAKRGLQGNGAGGGEVRAATLAKAIVDCVPGLDQVAIEGLIMFIGQCYLCPMEACDAINGHESTEA